MRGFVFGAAFIVALVLAICLACPGQLIEASTVEGLAQCGGAREVRLERRANRRPGPVRRAFRVARRC